MVHILSSQHSAPEIPTREDQKPQMILDYNVTKGAVDNAEKLIREYSSARKTSAIIYEHDGYRCTKCICYFNA